ncbi:uncharacterized protein isoform X2 [Rhodnius prolixus]
MLNGIIAEDLLMERSADLDEDAYFQETLRTKRSPQGAFSLSASNDAGVNSLHTDVTGTLLKTDRATLDGNAYYQRNFNADPKYQTGVGLNLNHDSGFTGRLNYDKMPGSSRLGAGAGYNIFESRDGKSSLNAEAFYNRNFGGFGPRSDYGGFLTYRRNF